MNERIEVLEKQVQALTERVYALEGRRIQPQKVQPAPITQPIKKPVHPKKSGLSEEKLAGTWFNRLGIFAIMLAVGFFLKWSFDNHLIGELGRIVIGILIGIGFLGAGEIFQRKKFPLYGQGFTGGGIAILYFSIFSAFAFYHLISQPIAFLLMILITAAASLLAIRYDSLAVGILGLVGGFATPFLLNNGSSNQIALLTYVTILNIGVIGVAFYKKWPVFNYLTFFFTYLTYALSHLALRNSYPVWPLLFLSFYFLAYLGVTLARNVRLGEKANWPDLILILANAGVYFFFSVDLINFYLNHTKGYWAVFLGILYFLLGHWIYRYHKRDKTLALTFLAIAAGFITLALPLQITSSWLAVAWAIEAAILILLSFKMDEMKARFAGYLVLGLALYRLSVQSFYNAKYSTVWGYSTHSTLTPWNFLNNTTLAYLFVLAIMGVLLALFYCLKKTRKDNSHFFGLTLLFNLLIVYFFTQEITAYYNYQTFTHRSPWNNSSFVYRSASNAAITVFWGIHATVLVILGFWRRIKGIRWSGLVYLGVVILKVFFVDLSRLSTPYRILSFIVLGVILLGISWLYQRYKHLIIGEVSDEAKV